MPEVPSKESTTISHSNGTKSQNSRGKNLPSLENNIFHQNGLRRKVKREKFASLTPEHLRSKREIGAAISKNNEISKRCANFTFTIKYEDEYKLSNNFSMMYKGRMYYYNEYRVMDDGLQVCNTSQSLIQQKWRNFIAQEKRVTASKLCNVPVDGFYHENYTLFKNFTVFFKATGQTFTRQDYGVIFGHFAICSAKLRLSCNDNLVNVKYSEQYSVFIDFSLFHNNKTYDYREYRFRHGSLEICASNDSRVQAIWKTQNSWEKFKKWSKCKGTVHKLHATYIVNKQFTVYYVITSQYFTRNDYAVRDGKLIICKEKLRPISTEYTQEDLLMCDNSIINIKYENEYKVWNNFSILYKNKMYDYTEYRVLNVGIKICNSTDNDVRHIWKMRNDWVKRKMHYKSCNEPNKTSGLNRMYYTVSKQFNVYLSATSQYFTRNDYGVSDGALTICEEKFEATSTEYIQDDLLICNDSVINIKYDDEYKVWNNLSILYKNKVYDYTEYRVLNDGIKICNSTDNDVRNIWKLRNDWVKDRMHYKTCNKPSRGFWLYRIYYTVNKQLTVYYAETSQYFTRHDYGVTDGKLIICQEKLGPLSAEYTEDDLLTCNDSIINIKYDDEYEVWTNFSILYKNKVYDYTEYRVLNDGIKICNSTDNYVRNIWKLRNDWVKDRMHYNTCNEPNNVFWMYRKYYAVNKQFTVYFVSTSQYFARNDYGVIDGEPYICEEKLRPTSTEYTKEDLLMCNDSTINIKYDGEYNVWNNFSILYKNKMYDYTEYRVLDDSIKICNSTENHVKNIWKVRNRWVKERVDLKSCNETSNVSIIKQGYYAVNKQFTVYIALTGQYFIRNDYGVRDGEPRICKERLFEHTSWSTEYTKEDLLMCNDSIINIKYDGEYKVWKNFSILYKNKVYDYTEYRVLSDSIKICNSTDNYVSNIWKLRNDWVKKRMHYKSCNEPNRIGWLNQMYYMVNKQFTLYLSGTSQYFTRNDYGVSDGEPYICKEKLEAASTEYTKEDLLMCNDSIINIKYDDEYKVRNDFSILYKNKMYDYTEYRVLNDCIKICNSIDNDVRNIWKLRNAWVKDRMHFKSCNKPITYTKYNLGKFTVLKDFSVLIQKTNQVIPKYDYGVFQGKLLIICDEKLLFYITNIKIIISPLCALALSFICLLLLLIVYSLLPELRTLPGLNLMSLSFAFLLWQTYLVAFLSLYSHVDKLVKTPCDRLFVTTKFITYSILMNAAVNVYHLRKTFCGNTLVKTDASKWKRFLKYTLFSWGIPVIVTIVYSILVKEDVLRFDQHVVFVKKDGLSDGLKYHERILFGKAMAKENNMKVYQRITGDCINGRITPNWSVAIDVYGFQGCLVLYVIVMFFFTAYRIRQNLKASSSIAQNTKIAKNHKFVILLKLSTTTALSYWFPLFISEIVEFNFDIKIALYTVTLLTGAYIGIAFVFTRRNYRLLREKYSPAKLQVSK